MRRDALVPVPSQESGSAPVPLTRSCRYFTLQSTFCLGSPEVLMNVSAMKRRIFKGFAVLAMLAVLGIGALLGSLWLEHRTEVTLPTPTGPFAVGRSILDWTDDGAIDTLAPTPGTKRELLVWIWYPSAGPSAARLDDYVPAQLRPKA